MAKKIQSEVRLKTASVLAFQRKLNTSDALLFSGDWNARNQDHEGAWTPVVVREKSVRGTISSRQKAGENDPAKLDADIQKANPQAVDSAALPAGSDTLKVQFTLRVLPGAGDPASCNNGDYRLKLAQVVKGYVQEHGFAELSRRYAANIANGRFLWRNRMGAEYAEVRVERIVDGAPKDRWTFNALDHDMVQLTAPIAESGAVGELAELISEGLAGTANVLLRVTAFARLGDCQEVFPSQEMVMPEKGASTKGKKGKHLYDAGGVAAIHSQKIGNAVRTIDTWHPEVAMTGPIPVEPYGSVTMHGRAYRRPDEKVDFYSLLDGWLINDVVPAADDQHFIMATLIRGGVFGESNAKGKAKGKGKDKDAEASAEEAEADAADTGEPVDSASEAE